jgi:GTP-binding protein HflX
VLDELGAGRKPRLTVFNKIDLLDADLRATSTPDSERAVFVSAATGEGIDVLLTRVGDALRAQMVQVDAVVPYARGELVARARSMGEVSEHYTDAGVRISGHLPGGIAAEVTAASRTSRNGRGQRTNGTAAGGG